MTINHRLQAAQHLEEGGGFKMAAMTGEKRFGPVFFKGKDEEPCPYTYEPKSEDIGTTTQTKEGKSTKGFFTQAPRKMNADDKRQDYSHGVGTAVREQYQLPGEFAKLYSTKEILEHQKNTRAMRRRIKIDNRKLELKLGHGPGSYNTDKDTNQEKVSTNFSFGKAKRLDMMGFVRLRGEAGESHGPASYFPKGHEITKSIHSNKFDMKTLIAKEKQNDDLLDAAMASLEVSKSSRQFQRSFNKLSKSYSTPKMRDSRFEGASSSAITTSWTAGPGTYEKKSEFVLPKKSSSTFGKASRPDMLTSLIEAGFAPDTSLDPGAYTPYKNSSLVATTLNTRCGYVAPAAKTYALRPSRALQPSPTAKSTYTVRRDSRIFSAAHAEQEMPPEELLKALFAPPDRQKLGYQSYVPKDTAPRKKKKAVVKTISSKPPRRSAGNVVQLQRSRNSKTTEQQPALVHPVQQPVQKTETNSSEDFTEKVATEDDDDGGYSWESPEASPEKRQAVAPTTVEEEDGGYSWESPEASPNKAAAVAPDTIEEEDGGYSWESPEASPEKLAAQNPSTIEEDDGGYSWESPEASPEKKLPPSEYFSQSDLRPTTAATPTGRRIKSSNSVTNNSSSIAEDFAISDSDEETH